MGLDFFRRAVALRRGVRRRPAAAPHDPDQRHAAHRRVVRVPAREASSSSGSASTGPRRCTTRTASTSRRGPPTRGCGPGSTSSSRPASTGTCCARCTPRTRTRRSRSTATSATSSAPPSSSSSRSSSGWRRASTRAHRPLGRLRGVGHVPRHRLRRMGPARRRHRLRADVRRRARVLVRDRAGAVHLRRDLRQRRRARAQRRPLLLRPLRGPGAPARQHHRRRTWWS